jgi:hypothetical protein
MEHHTKIAPAGESDGNNRAKSLVLTCDDSKRLFDFMFLCVFCVAIGLKPVRLGPSDRFFCLFQGMVNPQVNLVH